MAVVQHRGECWWFPISSFSFGGVKRGRGWNIDSLGRMDLLVVALLEQVGVGSAGNIERHVDLRVLLAMAQRRERKVREG